MARFTKKNEKKVTSTKEAKLLITEDLKVANLKVLFIL